MKNTVLIIFAVLAVVSCFVLFSASGSGGVQHVLSQMASIFTWTWEALLALIVGIFVLGAVVVIVASVWDEFRR